MIYKTIPASQFAPRVPGSEATLTVYARPRNGSLAGKAGRWGVVICPGGGYNVVAPTEGEPVALDFLAAGVQAFVLEYSVLPHTYPRQLLELGSAVAWVCAHASDYDIDSVAVCGFSAGGHLAGCLGNLWQDPVLDQLGVDHALLRPDAAILCYPVISSACFSTPRVSMAGVDPALPEYAKVNLDTSVTNQNPPTFLWCTWSDQTVPMENTLAYAMALRRAGVSFELHVFPQGPHAMSVATRESTGANFYVNPHAAHWMPLCVEWLDNTPGREEPL